MARKKKTGALQTVIVKKSYASTKRKATAEAKKHADRIYTSRETGTSWRFRQRPLKCFSRGTFKTKCIRDGKVCLTYGTLKKAMKDRPECRRA